MPLVSVIMSLYKEPIEWMRQSIDSVLCQTHSNLEFIIINDNPNRDDNKHLLREYALKDKRIHVINNIENLGLTKSLNKGIDISKGEFVARMDADDICMSNRLELQLLEFEKKPQLGVCGTNIEYFGGEHGVRTFPENNDSIFLFIENCFAHSTIMAKRELMAKYKYNEECVHAQDYDLWYRMYMDGVQFHNIQIVLLKYRISTQQIGSNFRKSQDVVGRRIRRSSLISYLGDRCDKSIFGDYHVTLRDIDLICQSIVIPNEFFQKLLFYLAISVGSMPSRIILLFKVLIKYHMSYKYYIHLLYYYLSGKKTYLF